MSHLDYGKFIIMWDQRACQRTKGWTCRTLGYVPVVDHDNNVQFVYPIANYRQDEKNLGREWSGRSGASLIWD